MKLGKIIINLLSLLIFTINLQANDNNPTTLTQAEKWLSTANEKGFLENQGQMMDNEGKPVPQVLFKTEAPDLNIWVTKSGLTIQTLRLRKEPIPESELSEFDKEEVKRSGKAKTKKYFDWERVDIELKNATIKTENILKENPLQGHNNYFFPTCPDGIYGVKEYEKITIKDVYPGIDWVLYRNKDKGFKYDFIVHSGADYQQIELIYKSKTPININEQGELEMFTIYGKVKENKPVSFYENQEIVTHFTQNHQKPISINEDQGYETSISLKLTSNFKLGTSNLIIDPQLTWATFYGGNVMDGPMSIDTDNSGNIFIAGYTFSSNFPVQNAGTFFQGTNVGTIDAFILKFDNANNRLWATYYGGSGNNEGYSIATDGSGNVFVTGATSSANFPVQNAGTYFDGTLGGGIYDAFILKFDNTGSRLWATYYGGSGDDRGFSIATDYSGNVFVTGFTEAVNFPMQNTGTFFQGTNGGGRDAFILKFDNTGNRLWATYYGGSGGDYGYSIATDYSGNVFVTGFTESVNLPLQNAGTFFQGTNGGGTRDAFILKFDNTGNRLWATYYGGSGGDYGYSIATDGSGNVFVTGYTESVNFPVQNVGSFFQGTNAGGDAFILKFDNTGSRLWATYYGGSGWEYQRTYDNLAIDNCGNVYMSCETSTDPFPYLQNSCDAGYYDNTYNGGTYDILLSLFSNSGVLLWCTYVGGDGNDFREALTLDANNNLFMAGEWISVTNSATYPVTDPGGGTYYDATFNGGVDDGYILKFTPILILKSSTMQSTNETACNSVDGTATINIIGLCTPINYSWNNGSSTFNSTDTFNTITNLAPGTYFVTAYSGCDTIQDSVVVGTNGVAITFTQNPVICQGSSITVGINTYTTTGTFIDTLNILGCDSIITTNLTVNPTATGTDVITSCTPITWIDGNNYSTSTSIPTFTIVGGSTQGCDSIVTLNLTINSNSSTDVITACDSITWIDGNIYTVSTNSPTFTLTNTAGCDSVVTLNLSVNNSTSSTDVVNVCDSISWIDGITYTTNTNTPTFTLTNSVGCDSVVMLNLTINNPTLSTDIITACDSITWIDGNTYTLSNNTATYTLINSLGCDSIVTLNLTINSTTTGTDIITTCDSITWIDGITYTTSTNTPTFTLTNSTGCDSVITLDLTINNPSSSIDTQTACESYTWINGVTYTVSTNIPTFTIVGGAANGCDSIITLNLTINNSTTSTDVQTTCNSYVWIDGNTYTSNNNMATFTLTNSAGCDSVVTLNLTINNSTTSTDVQTACKTYTWIDGNTYFSSTSLPTVTLTNALGCDSIITLNLTIVTPVTTTQTFTECQGFSVAVGSNTYTITGVFTDVINGCDTMITNLTINDAPQFTLIKEDDNCGEHVGSVLVNVTSSIPPVSYIWNTGSSDSIISNLPAGTYTVTVNDGSGCSNINTISVLDLKLDCESFIFIPSVFTPNSDGQNDEFLIQLKGLEFISLEIYNRWGIKLFESTTKNKGWDGKTNTSNNATDGTYFFIVSYKTTDDEIMTKKGTLTLLR